ncbi:hypothetical protein K1719_041679, partial [Acacia pycnantha]
VCIFAAVAVAVEAIVAAAALVEAIFADAVRFKHSSQ